MITIQDCAPHPVGVLAYLLFLALSQKGWRWQETPRESYKNWAQFLLDGFDDNLSCLSKSVGLAKFEK